MHFTLLSWQVKIRFLVNGPEGIHNRAKNVEGLFVCCPLMIEGLTLPLQSDVFMPFLCP